MRSGLKALAASLMLALSACAMGGTSSSEQQPMVPTTALGAYLAAYHAQQVRDYPRAADFMNRALAADPGNFDLLRRTFILRLGEGHVTEAAPLAGRIVDLDHSAGLAQIVLVLEDAKAGRFAAALARAQALPRDGAERFAAPLLIAWCEMGLNRPAPAQMALGTGTQPSGLEELNALHRALLDDYADRFDEASAEYEKLVGDKARLTWRTVELAGNFYERHQRVAVARRLYERMASEEQGNMVVGPSLARIAAGTIPPRLIATPQDGLAEALFDLASILNQRETLDAATIYARLSLDLRPNFPIAQLLLAEIADQQQHPRDALALYQAIDPKSSLAWSARLREANMLDQLDRTDDAVILLNAMAEERPSDPEPLVQLGEILSAHHRYTEAVTAYDSAIARVTLVGPRHWRLFYNRAVALERSDQWPRAEVDLERALELQPEQPLVLNYLGYSWVNQGVRLQEAVKMVERAVALRPSDGYIVDSLGWAYFRLGQYAAATEKLERAIELIPEDPTINDHLGDAYWQSGRHNEARFQWRRALQFKPEADDAKKIEAKLDRGLAKPDAATRGG